jgi:hypothetical protein
MAATAQDLKGEILPVRNTAEAGFNGEVHLHKGNRQAGFRWLSAAQQALGAQPAWPGPAGGTRGFATPAAVAREWGAEWRVRRQAVVVEC